MIRCPACGAGGAHRVDIVGAPHASCPECYHLFQIDPITPVRYDAQYIKEKLNYPDTSAHLRLGYVLGKCSGSDQRLFDVGYGKGHFLHAASRLGHEVRGCEVHGQDYGLTEAPLEEGLRWATVVTFFDSLEHMGAEQFDRMTKLGDQCQAEHIIISIPAIPGDALNESLGEWKHFKPGEHLHYFSLASLSALMARTGPGYSVESISDIEDCLRGRSRWDGRDYVNILTAHFRRTLR